MLTTDGREFRFPEPGRLFTMTCVNHPEGKWLTKHPALRSIHWVGWDLSGGGGRHDLHPLFGIRECPCSFGDLRVVVDADGEPV